MRYLWFILLCSAKLLLPICVGHGLVVKSEIAVVRVRYILALILLVSSSEFRRQHVDSYSLANSGHIKK